MDINQLRTFVTVAREGSITRASELLYRSQPSISAHVKCMEDTLGIALFDRTPRGMSVTHQGRALLEAAEDILQRHRRLFDTARKLSGNVTGKVRIGVGPGIGTGEIVDVLAGLSAQFPDLSISLQPMASCAVRNGIRCGRLDAGLFVADPEDYDGIAMTQVAAVQTSTAACLDHHLPAGNGEACWQALAKATWVLPSPGSYRARLAERLFEDHGTVPKRIITVDDDALLSGLIADGLGVGIVYRSDLERHRASQDLAMLFPVGGNVPLSFGYLPERRDDCLIGAVRDTVIALQNRTIPAVA